MRSEERGQIQVKGIAQPVATYAVFELKRDVELPGTEPLRLELEIDHMSGDEAAANALGARKKRPHIAQP
jgi:hypothetical protein